jgi:hypothetical protein
MYYCYSFPSCFLSCYFPVSFLFVSTHVQVFGSFLISATTGQPDAIAGLALLCGLEQGRVITPSQVEIYLLSLGRILENPNELAPADVIEAICDALV